NFLRGLDECFSVGFVDPRDLGKLRWRGGLVPEPGGVRLVSGGERLGPGGSDLGGGAVVNRCRRVQADPGMAVDVVVVIEERRAERAGISDGAEPARERWAVLEGLEL